MRIRIQSPVYHQKLITFCVIVYLETPETVVLHAECGVDDLRDVVLQHPVEGGEEVRVHRLNICKVDRLVQQHLVERHREPAVNVMPMENSNP